MREMKIKTMLKWYSHYENSMVVSQKNRIAIWSSNPTFGFIYRWINKMWYLQHNGMFERYSALKRKEILSFATTWMNFEHFMLSETSLTKNQKVLLSVKQTVRLCCMRQGTQSWCSVTTWRNGVGREVRGGVQEGGNTCTSMADACWCLAKTVMIL